MSEMISLRISKQQKEALKTYAKLQNKSVSEVILSVIIEKFEDDEDYKDAVLIAESLNNDDLLNTAEFYQACGLDYDAL
jgi:uncharacterized protein (DUF1778 family)